MTELTKSEKGSSREGKLLLKISVLYSETEHYTIIQAFILTLTIQALAFILTINAYVF